MVPTLTGMCFVGIDDTRSDRLTNDERAATARTCSASSLAIGSAPAPRATTLFVKRSRRRRSPLFSGTPAPTNQCDLFNGSDLTKGSNCSCGGS